jgi:hypothetical protein
MTRYNAAVQPIRGIDPTVRWSKPHGPVVRRCERLAVPPDRPGVAPVCVIERSCGVEDHVAQPRVWDADDQHTGVGR